MSWLEDRASDRPTTIRGLAEQFTALVNSGRDMEVLSSSRHAAGPADRAEWTRALWEVIEWAKVVTARIDPVRATTIRWATGYNRMDDERGLFLRQHTLADVLRIKLGTWADELDLFPVGGSEAVIFNEGSPYTSWLSVTELLRLARASVCVVDPFTWDSTLDLLLRLPDVVSLRVLASKADGQLTRTAWGKFVRERGGDNDLRLHDRQGMFHDRLLFVDDRTFLSGGSFKDLGEKRLSILLEISEESVSRALRDRFEEAWTRAAPL